MKFGDAKPQTRGDSARLEDLVDVLKLPNGKWVQVRILPNDIIAMKTHWINILAGKTKREVKIPKLCVSFDPMTEETKKGVKCPYCTVETQTSVAYLVNVIVRSLQEDAPRRIKLTAEEKKSGFKDKDSESWTPVRVMRITSTLMSKILGLKDLNKRTIKGTKKAFDVSDAKYGIDINIRYDEKAKGGDKYQINLATNEEARKALSEEELAYLVYELSPELMTQMGLETPALAKKQLDSMQIVGTQEFEGGEDGDDDDDDDLGSKKKKAPAKKVAPAKKGKDFHEDDDDEDDDDDLDDDDEDDEPPKKGKKAPPAKKGPAKKRSSRDDDDEDDDEDDDDEDEEDDEDEDDEDEPPARSKKKAPPSKKRSSRDDDDDDEDDEDEDDDDEDEDDEDDEPPAKSKKKAPPAKKRSSRDDDDDEDDDEDDEDEDDDDDDEDDAPPPKKSSSKKAPPAKKKAPPAKSKKRSSRDEDDDEDEDDIPF